MAILNGRRLAPDLRVVLRLGDDDLAGRVQEVFGIAASSSVSQLAAPTFAAAMLGRHVLATIPVGRRVLLLGEVAVQAGSAWDGAAADGLDEPERLRVLAVQPGGVRGQPGQAQPAPSSRTENPRRDHRDAIATSVGVRARGDDRGVQQIVAQPVT